MLDLTWLVSINTHTRRRNPMKNLLLIVLCICFVCVASAEAIEREELKPARAISVKVAIERPTPLPDRKVDKKTTPIVRSTKTLLDALTDNDDFSGGFLLQ